MKVEQQQMIRKKLEQQVKENPMEVVDFCMELHDRIEKLESLLNKNSGNSSKPPSSDGYNKPKPKSLRPKSNRKPGGQKGHKGNTLNKVDNPDTTIEYKLEVCPVSGVKLCDDDIVRIATRQVFDLPEPKLEITEHRVYYYRSPVTGKVISKEFPQGVNAPTQYGDGLKAWLVYLCDYQLIPLDRISKLCNDLYDLPISQATIEKAREECRQNLEPFIDSTKARLQESPLLHTDETGLKPNGWLHVVSNGIDTLYYAHKSRGFKAIEDMGILESFDGVLMHDFWSAYFKLNCEHSLCNAHLLRELTWFEEEEQQQWAKEMKGFLLDSLTNPLSRSIQWWKDRYREIIDIGYLENPYEPPPRKKGSRGKQKQPKVINLLDRFRDNLEGILRFLTDSSMPFTNNLAERDLRMNKVKLKISGCFRTWEGAVRFATNRSYISTAIKRAENILNALHAAISGQPRFC